MAALQTAKKDLRRKVRDVLLTLPKDSIASQCQCILISSRTELEANYRSYNCDEPVAVIAGISQCQKDRRLSLYAKRRDLND